MVFVIKRKVDVSIQPKFPEDISLSIKSMLTDQRSNQSSYLYTFSINTFKLVLTLTC